MLSKIIAIFVFFTFVSFLVTAQNSPIQAHAEASRGQKNETTENNIHDEKAELDYFAAELQEKNVHVNWNMNHTNALIGFELYKSTDGKDWEMVDFLDCETNPETAFQYIDETPNWGINYYRIKSIDTNGKTALLRTAKVLFEYTLGADVGDFYPNPVSNGSTGLNINLPDGGEAIVYLQDSMGRTVKHTKKQLEAGADIITMELDGLKPGIYFATVYVNREYYSRKIMVGKTK